MKRILFGAVFVSALVFAASLRTADAADMPIKQPPVPTPWMVCAWCGFYVGINAGYATTSDNGIINTGVTDTLGNGLGGALGAGAIPSQVHGDIDGFIGGGQIGYNWQFFRDMVFGLEADFDAMSTKTTITSGPNYAFGPAVTSQYDREADWVSTLRARFGDAVFNNVAFIYMTAGVAAAEWGLSNAFICPACAPPSSTEASTSVSNKITRFGVTIGGGIEWKLFEHVSAKVEYLYVETGTSTTTIAYNYPGGTSTLTNSARDGLNILHAGLNWHF